MEEPPNYRKTALEVVQDLNLTGKLAIITGGSSGIGVETIRAFAQKGAHVINAVRDTSKANSIIEEIKKSTGNNLVETVAVDLASLKSVRSFSEEILKRNQPIHYLLLNAGVMMPAERTLTEDGFEIQFQVNFLSNFLILKLLQPLLVRGAPSRAVVVSSVGHTHSDFVWDDPNFEKSYNKLTGYASSKTAAILLVSEFNRRNISHGVSAFSVHPGAIMTGLQVHMSQEEKINLGCIDKDGKVNPHFKTVEQGAATTVWAATSKELDGKGGLYLEDCSISKPILAPGLLSGHAPWIYNEENEKKIWQLAENILSQK